MYRNNFLAIIKKDGNPLRELGNQIVHLPFNSEYTIELRNDNWNRALAKVYIDGTEVISNGVIIPAKSTVNLERFLLDGDLNKGNRFKFVQANSTPGVDPNNPQNGIVRIEFMLEQTYSSWVYPLSQMYTAGFTGNCTNSDDSMRPSVYYSTSVTSGTISSTSNTHDIVFTSNNNVGVTAEGGVSNQTFVNSSIGTLDPSSKTIIELILRGSETEITTKDKVFCTQCGKKIKPTFSFCPHCGAKVEL